MNLLDENIIDAERQQLARWRIHIRQIGVEIGVVGMDDREEIIPLLHTLRRPTFFTRDYDFYHPTLRHAGYCLVCLTVKLTKLLSSSAGFCIILTLSHKRSAWAKLLAFTTNVSAFGR